MTRLARVCLRRIVALGLAVLGPGLTAASALHAEDYGPATFEVESRRAELSRAEFAPAREACLAAAIDDALPVPDPVPALHATDGYGSDQSAEDFAWSVMVLSGRSLAGEAAATRDLVAGLVRWAEADALEATPTDYDPFYAMKRMLLPTMVGFRIVAAEMHPGQRATVEAWIDGLVRRLDTRFGGDVDDNNHRYLADLVLMTWGSIVRDPDLLARGIGRFEIAMHQARADGSLPLETRRGARALWYSNMAVGELAMMLQVASLNGVDLRRAVAGGPTFDAILDYMAAILATPELVFAYAVENYIPGPTPSYRVQDLGFAAIRGHGRHYMAWMEAPAVQGLDAPAAARLQAYAGARLAAVRPLIDEYSGGNTTCFYWRPLDGAQ